MSDPSEKAALSGSKDAALVDGQGEEDREAKQLLWSPSGSSFRDFMYFCGPGWFVSSKFQYSAVQTLKPLAVQCIYYNITHSSHCTFCCCTSFFLSLVAYVDPGNYQADIQAGATTRYYLLFCVWWSSLLSIYIQMLCVRLSYYGQMNLAQAQAKHAASSRSMRYLNWAIAEFSTIITDLPEVIGIGIACNLLFGWPYYVGVLLSLITTMFFLATMNYGINVLEGIVFLFVFIMAIALFVEMSFVGVDTKELMEGWFIGFTKVTSEDVFSITGILGAVVMPHNLYLHSAACQARKVERKDHVIQQAVKWSSLETAIPIVFSFFMNMAVVAIAAERVYGQVPDGDQVGLTDFCEFFKTIKGGCILWSIALLAAGQSSAITTTYTGQ